MFKCSRVVPHLVPVSRDIQDLTEAWRLLLRALHWSLRLLLCHLPATQPMLKTHTKPPDTHTNAHTPSGGLWYLFLAEMDPLVQQGHQGVVQQQQSQWVGEHRPASVSVQAQAVGL